MGKQRSTFWDEVKGLSIIAVMLIHTTTYNGSMGSIWRQFINFPVAMFFFVAGMFCHCRNVSYGQYIAKKSLRLLMPFIIATLLYACYGVWKGQPLVSALQSFPLGWGYFVIALLQCYIIAPFLVRMGFKISFIISIWGYLFAAIYLYLASTVFDEVLTLKWSVPYIFGSSWLPMFSLGLFVDETRDFLRKKSCKVLIYSAVSLLILSVASAYLWSCWGYWSLSRSQLRLSTFVFSVLFSMVCLANSESNRFLGAWWHRFLSSLGQMSFFVYLFHRAIIILFVALSPISIRQCRPVLAACVISFFGVFALVAPKSLKKKLFFLGM